MPAPPPPPPYNHHAGDPSGIVTECQRGTVRFSPPPLSPLQGQRFYLRRIRWCRFAQPPANGCNPSGIQSANGQDPSGIQSTCFQAEMVLNQGGRKTGRGGGGPKSAGGWNGGRRPVGGGTFIASVAQGGTPAPSGRHLPGRSRSQGAQSHHAVAFL